MIRIPQVRVVDEEGTQMGVMSTPDALRLAQDRGYDLVEVAPMASPPVARLLDYGQFKYEQARRDKEARRHQRSVEFKEIRLKIKIGKGDFDTKVRRAIQFLEDGDRVKVTVQFRGREVSHAYLGRDMLIRFARAGRRARSRRAAATARRPPDVDCHHLDPQAQGTPQGEEEQNEAAAESEQHRQSRRRRRQSQPRRPSRPQPPRGEQAGAGHKVGRSISKKMPKMKSHKGAQKRFGKTGGGKIVRVKAWRGHHLDIKSSRRTRRYAGKAVVDKTSEEQVKRLLPYL